MATDDQIYAVLVNATAAAGNARVLGSRHAIIVLLREEDKANAEHAALATLERNLWEEPEVRRIAPVNPKLGLSEVLQGALINAEIHGVALVVYDNPLPSN